MGRTGIRGAGGIGWETGFIVGKVHMYDELDFLTALKWLSAGISAV